MLPLFSLFSRSSVLWLVTSLDVAWSVRCFSCYDDPSNGAAHDTPDCPWTTGIAHNVAAIGAVGSALAVASLLPLRILRVFPKSVLHTLKSLIDYPVSSAGQMVLSGTVTLEQMVRGVQSGAVLKEDCLLHLIEQLEGLDQGSPRYSTQLHTI